MSRKVFKETFWLEAIQLNIRCKNVYYGHSMWVFFLSSLFHVFARKEQKIKNSRKKERLY